MLKTKIYPSPRALHRHACDACDKFQVCPRPPYGGNTNKSGIFRGKLPNAGGKASLPSQSTVLSFAKAIFLHFLQGYLSCKNITKTHKIIQNYLQPKKTLVSFWQLTLFVLSSVIWYVDFLSLFPGEILKPSSTLLKIHNKQTIYSLEKPTTRLWKKGLVIHRWLFLVNFGHQSRLQIERK